MNVRQRNKEDVGPDGLTQTVANPKYLRLYVSAAWAEGMLGRWSAAF